MIKIFKVIGIIACILVLMVVFIITATVRGLTDAADDYMQAPQGQQIHSISPQGASVTATLHPRREVVLEGVELCIALSDVDASMMNGCMNGACTATLYYGDKPIPSSITVSQKMGEECVDKTIADVAPHVRIAGYNGAVLFDEAALAALGVTDASDVEKTLNSQFTDKLSVRLNSRWKIDFSYDKLVTQDEFLIGTTPVQVQYILVPAPEPEALQ